MMSMVDIHFVPLLVLEASQMMMHDVIGVPNRGDTLLRLVVCCIDVISSLSLFSGL